MNSNIVHVSLVTAVVVFTVPAAADIKVEGTDAAIEAYIRPDGRVEDASFRTLGYVRPEGRVEDERFRTLGYVRDDGRVEDAKYWAIGYFRDDGRIEDASFRLVGYVREGVIQDIKLKPVGFFEVGDFAGNADAALAAYVFFFSPVLFPQPPWDTVCAP